MVVRLNKVLEEKQRGEKARRLYRELEESIQELRRLDEIKSEFVSVASHELRTPLAAIKNAVQLILTGKTGTINETQVKFLSMAERNINRLMNILNDLFKPFPDRIGKDDHEIRRFGPERPDRIHSLLL